MNNVEKARLFVGPTEIPLNWNPLHNSSDADTLVFMLARQVETLEVLYTCNTVRVCVLLKDEQRSYASGRMFSTPKETVQERTLLYRTCVIDLAAMLYDHYANKTKNSQSEVRLA